MNDIRSGAPDLLSYENNSAAVNSYINPNQYIHVADSGLCHFFSKYLLQKAMSVFRWKLPKSWDRDYFLYSLYCWGSVAVFRTAKYGVIPQACSLSGRDIFYRPNTALISNPLINGTPLKLGIGADCVLFKLQPNYSGIMDIVTYYAEMMALCAQNIGVNLINSKLAYVFTANSKSSAESFKKIFDDIASGKPATVIDKNLRGKDGKNNWEYFSQNLSQNYIAGDVLSDLRKIEQMFDTDIGIPNANTDKRERLITDEVNSNNIETFSKCDLWLEELQKRCDDVGELFGVEISVDWRYPTSIQNGDD